MSVSLNGISQVILIENTITGLLSTLTLRDVTPQFKLETFRTRDAPEVKDYTQKIHLINRGFSHK